MIQIALLLAAIFAAGVATGRFTAPRGPTYVRNAVGKYVTADRKLEELTRRVGLDAKQREQFRVLLEEIAQEMANHPPASQERLEVFRRSVPRQRALLHPDQHAAFDAMVQETERRYEQVKRRKSRDSQ